jgi:putative ATPase
MSNLFAAASMDKGAPRPLADRLRPQTLAEVVGQDQLTGPDGALTRLVAGKTIGSLIFWGPPGTGKTTVARLLAHEINLRFLDRMGRAFAGMVNLVDPDVFVFGA